MCTTAGMQEVEQSGRKLPRMHKCREGHEYRDVQGRATQGAVAEDALEQNLIGRQIIIKSF